MKRLRAPNMFGRDWIEIVNRTLLVEEGAYLGTYLSWDCVIGLIWAKTPRS